MRNWMKQNWKKSLLLLTLGYVAHILIEAFVVTNILALFGVTLPVLV